MNAVTTTDAPRALKLTDELAVLGPEVQKVLPAHVTPERFMRVVMTAIANNPALAKADRRSLLTSAVKAAQDGLLPDGREGALVIFRAKEKGEHGDDRWIEKVQWMPMVAGILSKVRRSGELLSLTSNVVYQADQFRYWIDDDGEHITHEPNVLADDRGSIVAVYAIAKTKDAGTYTEVMSLQQIEQVRSVSRSRDSGPWAGWYGEMARKTVIRRLSKRLPMSTDLETVIRRDDELYDLNQVPQLEAQRGKPRTAAPQALAAPTDEPVAIEPEAVEIASE